MTDPLRDALRDIDEDYAGCADTLEALLACHRVSRPHQDRGDMASVLQETAAALASGPRSLAQLAAELGVGAATVHKRIQRLRESGIGVVSSGQTYALSTMRCAWPGCDTILSRYNTSRGHRYCSVHAPLASGHWLDGIMAELEADMQTTIDELVEVRS